MASVNATLAIDVFDGITGTSSGDDIISAVNGTANAGDVWSGGGGNDALKLTSRSARIDLGVVSISGIETLTGGRRGDIVTLSVDQFDGFSKIDFGKGKDTLTVKLSGTHDMSAATLATLAGVEVVKLTGSAGNDYGLFSGSQLNTYASIAMGAGTDTIALMSASTRLNTLADTALTGVEIISAAQALAGTTIDLALQTEAFSIVGSTLGDTLAGGTAADDFSAGEGNDIVRLSAAQYVAGEAIDGGNGNDTVLLTTGGTFNFAAAKFVAIENINGTAANEDVRLSGTQWNALTAINLGGGTDSITIEVTGGLTQPATLVALSGVENVSFLGSAKKQLIALSGEAFDTMVRGSGTADFGLGGDILRLSSTSARLNALSDSALSGLEKITAPKALTAVTVDLSNQTEKFTCLGGKFSDSFTTGAGNDVIRGGFGNDTLTGGVGNDRIDGGADNDVISGGQGNDIIVGGKGSDTLSGDDGIDTLSYLGSVGGVVIDLSLGTAASGFADGDVISGFENILGSRRKDALTGDAAANVLTGGYGNDILMGGGGSDTLNGGGGQDTASYKTSAAGVTVDLTAGTAQGGDATGDTLLDIERVQGSELIDSITGDASANQLFGYGGNDILTGNDGADRLDGGQGQDTLYGGSAADVLIGGAGNDILQGGDGRDLLMGGFGQDTLTGGINADIFRFSTILEAGTGSAADMITDFVSNNDRIDLSNMDADTLTGGDQAFTYLGGTAFTHQAGQLIYNAVSGILSGDVTGDGVADFNIRLVPGSVLLGTDFIL